MNEPMLLIEARTHGHAHLDGAPSPRGEARAALRVRDQQRGPIRVSDTELAAWSIERNDDSIRRATSRLARDLARVATSRRNPAILADRLSAAYRRTS